MEHVVYLMVKRGGRADREPVAVERLQLEQVYLSRVTLLEAYLEAWRHPSHVCGVIRDKIRERGAGGGSMREQHRCFPDYQVWDRSFEGYLRRSKSGREWLRVWRIPMFEQYGGPQQLQTLMRRVEGWGQLSQILVLGYAPDAREWLPGLARRARGVHFYLDYEPRDMEGLGEWLEEEYGLMTQRHVLGGSEGQAQPYPGLSQCLHSHREPCLVVDFTGVANIPVTGLCPGSMWWDMGAMEEKRHMLEDRPLGVRYVSMRTLWRDLEAYEEVSSEEVSSEEVSSEDSSYGDKSSGGGFAEASSEES